MPPSGFGGIIFLWSLRWSFRRDIESKRERVGYEEEKFWSSKEVELAKLGFPNADSGVAADVILAYPGLGNCQLALARCFPSCRRGSFLYPQVDFGLFRIFGFNVAFFAESSD